MDITQLILDDHHEQRRLFAILEQIDRTDTGVLSAIWSRLAAFLELHAAAEVELEDGLPLSQDPILARKFAELEIELMALEYTEFRMLAGEGAGKSPGPESSLLKIKGSEIQQRVAELTLEVAGRYGAPHLADLKPGDNELPVGPEHAVHAADTYFNMRKTSIYGGSNEIQRNIIAKAVLGL